VQISITTSLNSSLGFIHHRPGSITWTPTSVTPYFFNTCCLARSDPSQLL